MGCDAGGSSGRKYGQWQRHVYSAVKRLQPLDVVRGPVKSASVSRVSVSVVASPRLNLRRFGLYDRKFRRARLSMDMATETTIAVLRA